jgi:site-specific DNA-methyltransferase (adenine-specific)
MQQLKVCTKALENHQQILGLKKDISKDFILLGKYLKENRDDKYFKELGYQTFEDYIESRDIELKRASVYELIRVYEKFIGELKYSTEELLEIDYSKLRLITPVLDVYAHRHKEWIAKAKNLSFRGLKEEIKNCYEDDKLDIEVKLADHSNFKGELNIIHEGDCIELLNRIPLNSVDFCMTSPPYWNIRDYGVKRELGSNSSHEEYVDELLKVIKKIKGVLKDSGSFYLDIGDTYKDKSLLGLPWRVALEMMDEQGWILRNCIIWNKGYPIPVHINDRLVNCYEFIFHFLKSNKYYYSKEATQVPVKKVSMNRRGDKFSYFNKVHHDRPSNKDCYEFMNSMFGNSEFENTRSIGDVWNIRQEPYYKGHLATYPEKICEIPIKSSCPEGGIVLDPFAGSGTTLVVAKRLGRKYIGIELNPKYVELARKRLDEVK